MFNDKNSSPLQVIYRCNATLEFMVVYSAGGAPRPVCGGLCTVEDYNEGYFYPTWVTT
jgi:hypothetical protein